MLRLDNCGFRLSRPVETLSNLKPLLKSMTALATVSVNNMTCVASDLEEGGAARVRDLLEKHTPLLCSLIKHLPNLERLSMMRYEVCPEQLPRLVRAIKSQVSRRNGVLTLQAKHAGRCRVHPDPTAGDPALTSLISRLIALCIITIIIITITITIITSIIIIIIDRVDLEVGEEQEGELLLQRGNRGPQGGGGQISGNS